MDPLGLVELEGAGDGVEHAVGGALDVAALELGVIVDADAREVGDLLAPQAGHATGRVGGDSEPGPLGRDLRPARHQELAHLVAAIHGTEATGVLAAPPCGAPAALPSKP